MIGRFWRTVRPLRPVQIQGRLWFRLHRPRPDHAPPPALRARTDGWRLPASRPPSLTGPERFLLLNEHGSLAEHGWDGAGKSKLWRYNQHYFEDLVAQGAAGRRAWHEALIDRWIRDHPPGPGTGWEPYPLSLRIVNWIKWSLGGSPPAPAVAASLAVQARWLARRLEWHLLGNHLFANAKALLFAAGLFDGAEADRWRNIGQRILARELDEQFLPDGAQFERSPMYHALGLEDLLDLVNLARAYPDVIDRQLATRLADKARAALGWLAAMSHDDDRIAFFNDAAFGIAAENTALRDYAARLGIAAPAATTGLTHLAASGYARLARGPALLLLDAGEIGPAYLPGHAHAQTLCCEFSLFGQRLFVNSGTSEYGSGPERLRQRGTAAHNTVCVAGRDSSEVWGGFRVGRRARVRDVRLTQADADGSLVASASHDGYRFLPGRPVHRRTIRLTEQTLRIDDEIRTGHAAQAHYLLHPALCVRSDGATAILTLPGGQQATLRAPAGALRVEPATWHPGFGMAQPTVRLVLPLAEGRATLDLRWE